MSVVINETLLPLSQAGKQLAEKLAALQTSSNSRQAYRLEIQINGIDLCSWLSQQNNAVKIFWEDRSKDFSVAGIGAAHLVNTNDTKNPYSLIDNIKGTFSADFPHLQYFGGFCFNSQTESRAEWNNWGRGRFVLPQIEIRRIENTTILACNIFPARNSSATLNSLIRQLKELRNPDYIPAKPLTPPYTRQNIPNQQSWTETAEHIIKAINQNKFEKIVLARCVRLDFDNPVNPFDLMTQLRATTSNCFCFIFQFEYGESFIGASPERLYRRIGAILETEAVAGTRPRGKKDSEDSLFQNDLLFSLKDNKEQNYVVTMIQKTLETLCTTFKSDKSPSLLNWSAGHHLITHFHGQLKKDISDLMLLVKLHPTPAVAGTPTAAALAEINAIEAFDRGWYCGPIGYIGFNHSEFAVAIRCALLQNNNAYLYAGAGIIKESSPQSEWQETENKLINFLKSFNAS